MLKLFAKLALTVGFQALTVGVMVWGVYTMLGGERGTWVETVVDYLLNGGLAWVAGGLVLFVLAYVGPYFLRSASWLVQDFR